MKPLRHQSPGFTLIELMISVSIIITLTGSAFALISHLALGHEKNQARLSAQDEAQRGIAQWRHDISLANSIELKAQGDLLLQRSDDQGQTRQIRYQVSEERQLLRIEQSGDAALPEKRQVIGKNVENVHFQQLDASWQAEWTATWSDGITTWRWPAQVVATPLNGLAE